MHYIDPFSPAPVDSGVTLSAGSRRALTLLVALLVAVLTTPASATGQKGATGNVRSTRVTLELLPASGSRIPPTKATLTLTPVVVPAGMDLRAKERSVRVPGRLRIVLPRRTAWYAKLTGAKIWSEGQSIYPRRAHLRVDLKVLPTGAVTGSVAAPKGEQLPKKLTARFQSAPGVDQAIRGSTKCSVAGSRWSCQIPAGRVDLSLKGAREIAHYFWDISVSSERSSDLGRLLMIEGSSVVGYVQLPTGKAAKNTLVYLKPRPAGSSLTPQMARELEKPLSSTTNARGFFQLAQMSPGDYELAAKSEGVGAATFSPIQVGRFTEVSITKPLVLEPPANLAFAVSPPVAPDGSPWRIRLMRETLPGHLGAASTGATNEQGAYEARNLAAGRYAVRLVDSSGTYYDFKWVTVPDQRRVEFSPDVVRVVGTITLGGDPLRAKIWFGGQHAEVNKLLESDEKGHFSGILPRAGDWTVEVHSKGSRIDSRIVGVEVEKRADGRPTEVDLAVPDTELEGRTIDPSGDPVGGAFVVFYQPANKTSFFTRGDSDGSFEVRGIAKGRIWVSAQARDKSGDQLSAPQQPVQVMKGHTSPSPVLLILSKAMEIKGRVARPDGQPEIGAQIIAFALDHDRFSSPVSLKAVTSQSGSFDFSVPSQTDRMEVLLEPPGAGALRAVGATDLKRTTITLTSELDGGELRVTYPPTYKPGSSKSVALLLFQDGHPVFWPILSDWAHAHGELTGRNLKEQTIPAMAPGAYSVCVLTPAEAAAVGAAPGSFAPSAGCPSGVLMPGGTLTLDLGEKHP